MPFTLQDVLLAQAVQSAALPPDTPSLNGLEIAIRAISAQELGGDFHLVIRPQDQQDLPYRVGLAVGDVAGKGLPASLVATSISHLLPWLAPLRDPAGAFLALNQELLEKTPSELYTSLVFAETDTRTDVLRVWHAGHPPALLWHAATGRVETARSGNLPLGCFEEWQGEPQEWHWDAGDILVLYSDGLAEVRDSKGQMFGVEGITQVLERCGGRGSEEVADALMEEARLWGAITDDVTLLVCSRTQASVPPHAPAPRPVRVVLVDDHCIWRDGMRALLEDTEFQVVGEASSGNAGGEVVRSIRPDLVLLDVRMADGDGLMALAAIRKQAPEAKVLMLTTFDHPDYKARALARGASSYLLKGTSREEMLAALRAAMRREKP